MPRRVIIGGAAALVVLGAVAAAVLAQQGDQPQAQRDLRWLSLMQPAAIAVADGAVFVVRGDQLLKFDAGTLELLAQADLPAPTGPARLGAGQGAGARGWGAAIRAWDADHDGVLTRDEIPEQYRALLLQLDTNGDGKVNAQERAAGRGRLGALGAPPPQP